MNNFNNTVDYTGADTVKKKSKGAIVGIGALVIVGASVLSYVFVPQVKNAVRMATLKPNEYVQTVAKDNCSKVASAVAKQYVNRLENTSKAYDYSVNAQLSENFIDTILGEYASYLDLPDSLVRDYSVKGNVDFQEDTSEITATLLANQDSLVSLNFIGDNANKKVYFQIPELSDSYIYISLDEETEEYSNYLETLEQMSSKFAKNDISAKEVEDTINKYSNIIIDNLTGDSTLEKNVEGSVLNVQCKYNVVSTQLSESTYVDMCNQIATELETDETVKKIFLSNANTSEDDYNHYISNIQDSLSELSVHDEDDYILLQTYIDSKGVICGFKLADDTGDSSLALMGAKDNLDYAVQFVIDIESSKSNGTIDLTATQTSKGVYDGNLSVNDSNENVLSVDFTNVSFSDDSYSGSFSTDISNMNDYFENLTFDISGDKTSQNATFKLDDLLTISGTVNFTDNKDITIPTTNTFDYDTQYTDYIDSISDTESQLEEDILKKIGLYDWYEDKNSVYSSSSDYDYDDYYDYEDYSDYDDDYELSLEDIEGDVEGEEDYYNFDDVEDDEAEVYFDFQNLDMSYNSEKFALLGEPTNSILSLESGDTTESYYGNNAKYYTDNDSIYIVASDDGIESIQVVGGDGISETIPDFKVNGVGIGSTYKDINNVFESSASENASNITVYDIYSEYLIEFYLNNGVIYGIFIW